MSALLAAVAVALGAVAQSATGFGFSLVSAPFLIAAYRAPTGVRLNLVFSLVINLALLAREHRRVDLRAAGLLLVPATVVTVPVALAVRRSQPGPMTVMAGLMCLAGVAALARGRQFRGMSGLAGTAAAGAVSGGMNAAAGISGPPVVLFAINARWPLERARPTMQLFFFGLNAVTLASLGWPDRLPLGVVIGFAAGVVAGALLAGRLPEA
ncbi:MAG: sulfite exporter TauE/SafE family protein, partial [Actinomycetota bacterium]|nr:sulfite exporter TauE/SafE family protein [Actinomycetota bacterium]